MARFFKYNDKAGALRGVHDSAVAMAHFRDWCGEAQNKEETLFTLITHLSLLASCATQYGTEGKQYKGLLCAYRKWLNSYDDAIKRYLKWSAMGAHATQCAKSYGATDREIYEAMKL